MSFDIIIRNGRIIDGTGNPWFLSDITIKEGKITKIERNVVGEAKYEIDASEHVVCPGFINVHSHTDNILLVEPKVRSNIHQGITTLVVGNCGLSWAPVPENKKDMIEEELKRELGVEIPINYSTFHEYLKKMEKIRCPVNLAFLIGYGIIRKVGGQGYENRPPTQQEFSDMRELIKEGMEAGALGMSTGLMYAPQSYSNTEEIIKLAQIVGEYNGIYTSHIRDEGDGVIEAMKECIEIAEKSGCKGHISHHKIAGKKNWGKSQVTLQLIEDANSRGVDITYDQYPYNRGATSLKTVLPPWVHEGGLKELLERLKNNKSRTEIKEDIIKGLNEWENMILLNGFDKIFISNVNSDTWKQFEGCNISEITKKSDNSDDWETLFNILIDSEADVGMTIESMSEEDISKIMVNKHQMFGTDCVAIPPTGGFGKPHPRGFGTYPRVLGKYVREEKLLTLEDAIRRMTLFPARKFNIKNRGIIREQMWADIVIFNPKTVIDKATYKDPQQYPEGIPYVIVNGAIVIDNGIQKRKAPGMVLRRTN